MDKKVLWLGYYLKVRNVFKTIKRFEENRSIEEILAEEGYKIKEIEKGGISELEKAEKNGVKILFREEEEFPAALKEIPYAPLFLYVKGQLEASKHFIAIIGSRKPTSYGKEVAYKFSKGLSENGIGIVSGLARGIDTIAHRACLEVNGYTIAVLGSGIDVIYPAENRGVYEEIIKKRGAVVSEFPFGTKPRKENFPMRNRIISGLSQAIVVVEAGKRSGTLITAKWALDQGKEVFAIPGNIFSSQSEGTHYLLKQGAILVTSPAEIIEYLGLEVKNAQPVLFETEEIEVSDEEKEILEALSSYPQHIEEIFAKVNKPPFEILSLITDLELKGLVETLPGKYVKLRN
jgi:DNA processing protein